MKPHDMENLTEAIGKTVLSVDTSTANCWTVEFTNGTSVSIWSNPDYRIGSFLSIEDKEVSNEGK